MLRGISPLLSPDLLATLCRMGHGDELVLADAHFPGETYGRRVLRADGLAIVPLLAAILPLFVLDTYVAAPVVMMDVVGGDVIDPAVEAAYRAVIVRHYPATPVAVRITPREFYERTRSTFAVVMTGDTAKYANLILRKGVTPIDLPA